MFVVSFHKVSERMKIVDVLGARTFKDGECIITQVVLGHLYLWLPCVNQ